MPHTNVLLVGTARAAGVDAPSRREGLLATDWLAQHPLSGDIAWAGLEPVGAFVFDHMPGAATVLAAGDVPLIEARTTPHGREVRLALEPGAIAGADLAVLVNNVLGYMAPGRTAGAAACIAGSPCALSPNALSSPVRDEAGQIVWQPHAAAWLADDATLSFTPTRAGLYTHADNVLAVNAPAAETAAYAGAGPVDAEAARFDLMPVLVAVALALLLVEFVLYARGKERPLSARALSRGMPGAGGRRAQIGLRIVAAGAGIAALLAVPLPMADVARDVVLVAATADGTNCQPLPGRGMGVVALGATPVVSQDMDCAAAGSIASSPPGESLAAALELAVAMVRPDKESRIVVEASGMAPGVASLGQIPVDVLPQDLGRDTYVGALDIPGEIFAGDTVPIVAHLHAASATTARLAISTGVNIVSEQDVDLVAGANRVDAELPALLAGEHRIAVSLSLDEDVEPGNNLNAIIANVLPLPRVAIVTSQAEEGQRFAGALAVQGIDARVLRPRDAPFALDGWLAYGAVALLNVPAIDLDTKQQDQLETLVRDYGRGLLLLGGENTFGPGGYFQTPLERLSPLSSRVPDDLPAAALVFVLDRSGSMQALVGDATRLDIARQATISAVELLNPESQVGVVAFDTEPQVVLPLQERKDEAALATALARLSPGGGTSIFPGLQEGLNQMETADSATRHIILMSDGLSQPGDLDALAQRASQMDVTISAVAIGSGADVGKLEKLAREGGGAFHVTQDFRALPSILSQEAMMLANDALKTGTREVFWVDRDAAFLAGMPQSLPPIDSYVLTSSKPDATLHVATRDDKGETVPLLASWAYGNGQVVALATHGAGPGSARWMGMPHYPMLWAQALRRSMSLNGSQGLALSLSRDGDDVVAVARAFDKAGQPVEGLTLTAQADGIETMVLRDAGNGEYRGRFADLAPGDYAIAVSGEGYDASAAVTLAYPARLDFARADRERMEALAAMSGGSVLPDAVLPESGLGWQLASTWRPWIVMALAAFLADLVLRYAPRLTGFPRRRAPMAGVPA